MINNGGEAEDNIPGAADDMTLAAQELLETLLQHQTAYTNSDTAPYRE